MVPETMYGDREVNEDDQTNPSHSYAVCKKYAEILAADYSQQFGMKFTGVRPTIGYGHGGRSPAQYWSDMPSFAAVGKPFQMDMDGKSLSSLVCADDLGEFTKRLIKAPSSPHPVYNVGGPPQSARDLAEVVKKYIPDAKITFGDRDPAGGQRGTAVESEHEIRHRGLWLSVHADRDAVRIHINDAGLEAGLPALKK